MRRIFGHERGLSRARPSGRIGCFELRTEGTLCWTKWSKDAGSEQAKLLRVLEDRRCGGRGAERDPVGRGVLGAANRNKEPEASVVAAMCGHRFVSIPPPAERFPHPTCRR